MSTPVLILPLNNSEWLKLTAIDFLTLATRERRIAAPLVGRSGLP